MVNQQKDSTLIKTASTDNNYSVNVFHGGEKIRRLICYKGKIVIPKSLQRSIVEWYHNHLCHPGRVRTELTIFLLETFKRNCTDRMRHVPYMPIN